MMLSSPVSLNRALESNIVKVVLPTHLRSNMLARLPVEIRRRSMFSAGEMNADLLQRVQDSISDVLSGRHTEETARSLLHRMPDMLSDQELSTEGRLRLVLSTNIDLARGYGGWAQTQDVDVLAAFPAWEFFRAEERKEPRDWPARWEDAGGTFFPGASDYPQGRMIALKDDDIWEGISAFGLPYAPFDFNSGMDLRDVDRDEAESLGLIAPGDEVQAQRLPFNDDVQATPFAKGEILDSLINLVVENNIGRLVGDGVLKLIGGGS